jgi:hypothetical protein
LYAHENGELKELEMTMFLFLQQTFEEAAKLRGTLVEDLRRATNSRRLLFGVGITSQASNQLIDNISIFCCTSQFFPLLHAAEF